MPFKIQKYCILDQCAKIDYFRNPYEICVHTNDQNRWDSKGSSATPAKQPRLSLSTSTVNVCCCHWEATTSSAAASTKAPLELQLRSENSASLLPKDERRVSYQPRTSTEVALTKWWTLVDTSPATVEHCHFGIEEKKCQFDHLPQCVSVLIKGNLNLC